MPLITELQHMQDCFEYQKQAFAQQKYPSYQQRKIQLKNLKRAIITNQLKLSDAIASDFGCRNHSESMLTDIMSTVSHINYHLKHLKRWMTPERRHAGLLFFPGRAEIHKQPKGTVGIITPWNYPIYLSVGPLVAALAAGNRVMIKMSEYTPNTNRALAAVLDQIFTAEEVALVEGEIEISQAFSALTFDHLLFTGSDKVGKSVLKSAADGLVPVTLELGGKSPCILMSDYSLNKFARDFIFGKILNSGQTCVAPDTIYCHQQHYQQLVSTIKTQYQQHFSNGNPQSDITSIITDAQWQRIQAILDDAVSKGATVVPLLDFNQPEQRQMPLTLVLNCTADMRILQEEIFGPLLPIIPFDDLSDAINSINAQPRPLALYLFSHDIHVQREVLYQTHSGGVSINDTVVHYGVDDLPVGGIGVSGMGCYHAEFGFNTFSHAKSVLAKGRLNLTHLMTPPYNSWIHRLIGFIKLR